MQIKRYTPVIRAFLDFAGWRAGLALALVFFGGLVEGIGVLMLIPLAQLVVEGGVGLAGDGLWVTRAADSMLSGFARDTQIAILAGGFAGLVALRAVLLWLRDTTLHDLRAEFVDSIRAKLFATLAAVRWRRIIGLGHADVEHVLNIDSMRIGTTAHLLIRLSVSLVMVAVQAGLAFALSPVLTTVVLGVSALGLAVSIPLQRRAFGTGAEIGRTSRRSMGLVAGFLDGIKAAKVYGLQDRYMTHYIDVLKAARRQLQIFNRSQLAARIGMQSAVALVSAAVLYFGLAVLRLDLAVMAALLILFARISGPLIGIQQGLQQMAASIPAYEAVMTMTERLRDAPRQSAEPAQTTAATPAPDAPLISLRGVGFDYATDPSQPALFKDISFDIQPGEIVAITGPSGTGKSTLLDLVCGLLTPDHGTVNAAGMAAGLPKGTPWQAGLAYVGQDAMLFDDTLRANLTWAAPDPGDAALWDALKATDAADLVRRLPDGLNTRAGERGRRLSGGERQRIGLAAAILRRPRLTILDEATNAMDIATERRALTGLIEAVRPSAVIVVTHRDANLDLCDRVLSLDDLRAPGR